MQLYKKTIVIWSDNDDLLDELASDAVRLLKGYSEVVAFGNEVQTFESLELAENDNDYIEQISETFAVE